jgi:hypothetical protein
MGQRFDELSKALASGVSRRRALMMFAGGLVGAAGAILPSGRSLAARTCPKGTDRCKTMFGTVDCCAEGQVCNSFYGCV